MSAFQCPISKKIAGTSNIEYARSEFFCNPSYKNYCGDCTGPKEIPVEELLANALENITYDDEAFTTVTWDDDAMCPYCGAEIDMSAERSEMSCGDTEETQCPVCKKTFELEFADVTITWITRKISEQ